MGFDPAIDLDRDALVLARSPVEDGLQAVLNIASPILFHGLGADGERLGDLGVIPRFTLFIGKEQDTGANNGLDTANAGVHECLKGGLFFWSESDPVPFHPSG